MLEGRNGNTASKPVAKATIAISIEFDKNSIISLSFTSFDTLFDDRLEASLLTFLAILRWPVFGTITSVT